MWFVRRANYTNVEKLVAVRASCAVLSAPVRNNNKNDEDAAAAITCIVEAASS